MSSFPTADDIIQTHEDAVEALLRVLHARRTVSADPRSRFHGLSEALIQERLEQEREELDRWALMMLVASFEAAVRTDAANRIKYRTKDAVRKPLRNLRDLHKDRVRLDDILETWRKHTTVPPTVTQAVNGLLRHRHWLAHGRHWTNKHGTLPSPIDARADIEDYMLAIQVGAPDFPRV
jgi:hypothetical protein